MQCILIYHIRISANISSLYSVAQVYSQCMAEEEKKKRSCFYLYYVNGKRCKNTAKVEESQITIWTNIKFMFASGLGSEKVSFLFLM